MLEEKRMIPNKQEEAKLQSLCIKVAIAKVKRDDDPWLFYGIYPSAISFLCSCW